MATPLAKPATKAPRKTMTAEEREFRATARRAAREEKEREAAEAERKIQELFEANRHVRWLEVWSQALRLQLLRSAYDRDVTEFFEDFSAPTVDAYAQTIKWPSVFWASATSDSAWSETSLTASAYEVLQANLQGAIESFEAYCAEKERKRLEAEDRARQRKAALDRISAEDKKLLGLS